MEVSVNTDDCWLWAKATRRYDYGCLWVYGRMTVAHRFMWEIHHGREIPKGMHIDHLCRIPRCINPDHLELVTPKENVRRCMSPAGIAARRTACVNGHEYTPENTARDKHGWRACRACARANYYRIKARKQLQSA